MRLQNPDWKVLPVFSFVDGYPRVLTYKDHDGGFNLINVHCCIWRTNIPSPVSDQFFHTVLKPWILKHKKVGYNSNRYQMVDQRISWKGPDTNILSSVGKTDHGSILIQEGEALF